MNKQQRKELSDKQDAVRSALDAFEPDANEISEAETDAAKKSLYESEAAKLNRSALHSAVEDLMTCFEEIAEAEREKFDNMPENMQQGERGQTFESNADTFDSAKDDAQSVMDKFDDLPDEWKEGVEDTMQEICDSASDLCEVEGE